MASRYPEDSPAADQSQSPPADDQVQHSTAAEPGQELQDDQAETAAPQGGARPKGRKRQPRKKGDITRNMRKQRLVTKLRVAAATPSTSSGQDEERPARYSGDPHPPPAWPSTPRGIARRCNPWDKMSTDRQDYAVAKAWSCLTRTREVPVAAVRPDTFGLITPQAVNGYVAGEGIVDANRFQAVRDRADLRDAMEMAEVYDQQLEALGINMFPDDQPPPVLMLPAGAEPSSDEEWDAEPSQEESDWDEEEIIQHNPDDPEQVSILAAIRRRQRAQDQERRARRERQREARQEHDRRIQEARERRAQQQQAARDREEQERQRARERHPPQAPLPLDEILQQHGIPQLPRDLQARPVPPEERDRQFAERLHLAEQRHQRDRPRRGRGRRMGFGLPFNGPRHSNGFPG